MEQHFWFLEQDIIEYLDERIHFFETSRENEDFYCKKACISSRSSVCYMMDTCKKYFSFSTFVIWFVVLKRFLEKKEINRDTFYLVLLVSLFVAIKMNEEEYHVKTSTYTSLFNYYNSKEFCRLELLFLDTLDWNVHVSLEEYQSLTKEIEKKITFYNKD